MTCANYAIKLWGKISHEIGGAMAAWSPLGSATDVWCKEEQFRVTGPLSYGCALVISNIVRHNYKVNHNTLKHTTIIRTDIVTSLHDVTLALWNSMVSPSGEWMCSGDHNSKI